MFISGGTSQNASYAQSISVLLPANAPQPFGSLGFYVPPGTEGVISTQLYALATIKVTQINTIGSIFITVVRGKLFTDPVVYSSVQTYLTEVPESQFIQQISAKAADYNIAVPPSRFLEYTAFISTDTPGLRVGPESFNGFAFNVIL